MDRSLHKTRASDGQALLLAVLIMIAILLIGTLFVAVVNYNQRTGGRQAQLLKTLTLAKAGMDHADDMLQFSPQGLDWRPELPPCRYTDGTFHPDFWGPDGIPYTYDDYYSYQEFLNGWYPLVHVGPDGNPGTNDDYYIRRGFTRYPDMGGGHFLLRVTYDPDPPYEGWQEGDPAYINPGSPQPDPLTKYIKIESIGVTEEEGFVSRKVQAYKPVALANYLLFVSDYAPAGTPAVLGYDPWIDMDKDAVLDNFEPAYSYNTGTRYTYHGPIRINTTVVEMQGLNLVSMTPADVGPPATPPTSAPGEIEGGGYLRGDSLGSYKPVQNFLTAQANPGDSVLYILNAQGFRPGDRVSIAGAPPYSGTVTDDPAPAGAIPIDPLVPVAVTYPAGSSVQITCADVPYLSAPDLFAQDPATGTMRWDALTREAGVVVTPAAGPLAGESHNTAELGWMWDASGNNQIAGLYVDNYDDLQNFGGGFHNINELIADWLASGPETGASGWNALGEVYDNATAVEIELFPSETATREYAAIQYGCAIGDIIIVRTTADLIAGPTEGLDANEIWWPNHNQVDGEPGIRLSRGQWSAGGDDGGLGQGQWALGDPNYPNRLGEQVGRTMYVDYPAGGRAVIFAEGNIRIKGRLPEENVDGTGRQYHLTVVSGGTIYIDGQILSPQDQYTRDVGDGMGGIVSDEYNTYIALLARDCVVVNPTMLVSQTNAAGAVAESDDLGTGPDKHWNLPDTPAGANVSGSFALGHIAHLGAGDEIRLVAYQRMDSIAGTTLTQLVTAGDPVIYVEDASSFSDGMALQATAPGTDALALGTIAAGGISGNAITLEAPGAANSFPAGSYVDNALSPPTTGINLPVYNSSTDTWNYYDFDQDGGASTIDAANIFWLTREPRDPDERHIWEAQSPWCPLQKVNPLVPGDIWWPWLLWGNGGATDWLGLTYAGVPNYVQFLMPTLGVTNPQDYWLKKFKLQEFDGTTPVGTIHAKINAVMYAQDGCFFVIPGRYFKEDVLGADVRPYLRYNYDVEIRGAITENFHPSPAVVREWQEKWAYPAGAAWNSIRYVYDETLLAARTQPLTTLSGVVRSSPIASWHSNTVKVPLLPASPDLLYYGEVP